MKKIFLGLLMAQIMTLLFNNVALGMDFTVKSGFLPANTYEGRKVIGNYIYVFNYDYKPSFLIGGELTQELSEQLALGMGADYWFSSNSKKISINNNDVRIGTLPVYGVVRYAIPITDEVKYFGSLKIGYSLFFPCDSLKEVFDIQGGVFYSVGIGLLYQKKFFTEIAYLASKGQLISKINGLSFNTELSGISLSIGMNLSL